MQFLALIKQRFAITIFAFAVIAVAAAQAEPHTLLTSHVPDAVSSGLAPLVGHVPPNQRLSLAISLPLRNEAGLDELVQQLYDPQSPNYHRYLSAPEFASQFGPTQSDHEAVLQFARAHGLSIVDTASNRMVIDVAGRAADSEPSIDLDVPLLHASGLDNFTLPVNKHVRSLQSAKANAQSKTTGSGPGGNFIGSDLRAAYYGSGSLTGSGQSVGLFEFAGYQ